MTFVAGAALLAVTYLVGGWYWCLVAALAVLLIAQRFGSGGELFLTLSPGLVWLVAFSITGDRRLFFPFTLFFAATLGLLLNGRFLWGAALILGAFTAVRIVQSATLGVLAVELVVASAAVGAAWLFRRRGVPASPLIASLVAFAGLVF